MKQTWENGKKTNFRPNFDLFSPNLGPKIFFGKFYPYYMLDFVASYHCMQFHGKLMIQTRENDKKPHLGPNFGPLGSNPGHQFSFFFNLALSVTRYHSRLLSCTISEKTNDPILRKFSDGWMGRWTDRQTDGREWFHRTLSD